VYLGDFELFENYLVLEERARGLTQIRIVPWSGGENHYLRFDEPAYRAHLGANLEFDTKTLRFEYTSMKTPVSIYDYDMATRQKALLKREEILGKTASGKHAPPDPNGVMHESLTGAWNLAEFVWKKHYNRKTGKDTRQMNLYRRRMIPPNSLVHESAFLRGNGYSDRLPSDVSRIRT